MEADDVLSVVDLLRRAGTDFWVGGGWGIDTLIGRQSRDHRDLDLMHRLEQEPAVLAALGTAGFVETLDQRPVRFVLTDSTGRAIDLHPLVFAEDGSALQSSFDTASPFHYPSSSFVTGNLGGTVVPCLSAEQQVYFHQGYEPTDRDLADMAQIRMAFGIATHF
ncbi:nucleotidyltransferase domain-containing protein [Kitasatospora paranensis]|uniref:Nucleotidyltransferase domain-containing protein n=1 Tax=Kitasatospora paranensis TaxID=258053 RepID=A0ABW2FZL4_9ACTN